MNNEKTNLRKLVKEDWEYYGNQGHNQVYKKGDDLKLYNPYTDEILCSWNLEDLMDGI